MAISFAILARIITPSQLGIFAVLTLILALTQLANTPFSAQAVTKYVAENIGRNDMRSATSAFYQTLWASLAIAFVVGLVLFLGSEGLSRWMLGNGNQSVLFQVVALDQVLVCVMPILTGALLGLQKFREQAVIGLSATLVRQAFIIILVIAMRSLLGLVMGWVIGDLTAVAVYSLLVVRSLGRPCFLFPLKRLFAYSWPLSINSVVGFASSWFDRVLLLLFVSLATVGVYTAAITAFGVLSGMAGAFSNTLFSGYALVQGADRRETLEHGVFLASRYLALIVTPLAFGLLATSKIALVVFVGQAYVGGSLPLMILTLFYALTLVGTVLSPLFLARGETFAYSGISIISVAVSFSAAFLLVPVAGMVGAAMARGMSMVLSLALTVLVLKRKINLKLDLQAVAKSVVAAGIMAVIVALAQVALSKVILLPAYVLLGSVVYLVMLRLLRAIRVEDVDFAGRFFGRRLAFASNLLAAILLPRQRKAIGT